MARNHHLSKNTYIHSHVEDDPLCKTYLNIYIYNILPRRGIIIYLSMYNSSYLLSYIILLHKNLNTESHCLKSRGNITSEHFLRYGP